MALTNAQYNEILRMYDRRQDAVRAALREREEEIDEKIPAYRALTGDLAGASTDSVRRALYHPEEADGLIKDFTKAGEEIAAKKRALLLSHGYPEDYLEPAWFCPDCQDTGFIGNEKCHCFREAAIRLVYDQSELAGILAEENFSRFNELYYDDTVTENSTGLTSRENIREIRGILEDFDRNYLLYGSTGLGKTFLCHCVAKEFLDRAKSVQFYTAPALNHLLEEARFSRDSESASDARQKLTSVYDCELLIIDDLGTELVNSFTASELLELLDRREAAGLSTILSTNLSPAEIRRVYSERVYSRLIRDYVLLKLTGLDIRRQIAES